VRRPLTRFATQIDLSPLGPTRGEVNRTRGQTASKANLP
jgi:hypothetical protein